jgi:hypothetical protein
MGSFRFTFDYKRKRGPNPVEMAYSALTVGIGQGVRIYVLSQFLF